MVVRLPSKLLSKLGSGLLRTASRIRSLPKAWRFKPSRVPLVTRRLGAARNRVGSWAHSTFSKGKEGIRKTVKGAWRKISVDPGGTAISAYSAIRTPVLKLDFPGGGEGSVSDPKHVLHSSSFSSW